MRNKFLFLLTILCFSISYGQEIDSTALEIEKIEKSLNYATGTISLEKGNGKITVPKGFKFLNKEQSNYVLTTLWGNPENNDIIGMLVPQETGVLGIDSWAFTISYDPMGYVDDKDAQDIDYEEMLVDTKKDIETDNESRKQAGYESIELIGWASKPYYDDQTKVLHWAKEIAFGQDSLHTLNYNLRVLGRHGVYLINAVAGINQLAQVKQSIDPIIASVSFKEGEQYSDYVEGDEIASWTVGSLVAGKILAKTGFFAVILKFCKFIAVAFVGGFSYIWKKIRGRKEEEYSDQEAEDIDPSDTDDTEEKDQEKS